MVRTAQRAAIRTCVVRQATVARFRAQRWWLVLKEAVPLRRRLAVVEGQAARVWALPYTLAVQAGVRRVSTALAVAAVELRVPMAQAQTAATAVRAAREPTKAAAAAAEATVAVPPAQTRRLAVEVPPEVIIPPVLEVARAGLPAWVQRGQAVVVGPPERTVDRAAG